jgi:uncharacterized protein YjbI with pentapeptide repeats
MLKPTIFISYKRHHQPTVEAIDRLEVALRTAGFEILRDVNIEAGNLWSNDLYRWLIECSAAIAIVGPEAAQSEWCRREWWFLGERHRTTGLPVIPIAVDGSRESAGILDEFQALKVSAGFEDDLLPRLTGLQAVKPTAENYLAAHHAWLRWQFNDAPIWGREPFALGDIYAETDCGRLNWSEIVDEKLRRDPIKDDKDNGGRHNLIDTVMGLFADPKFRDLVVVQGPPGCGKSAFTLRLANELLAQGMRPILVRFRDFRLTTFNSADELIEDALRIGPVEEEPPRPDQPVITSVALSQGAMLGKASVSKLFFILDGWDEVSLTGNTSYQAQLQSWLPRIREFFVDRPGPAIRLILTGRPSAEVRSSGILKRDTPVLTVRLMTPATLRGLAGAIESNLLKAPALGRKASWSLDRRRLEAIFSRYETWFADPHETHGQSMEVVGSPLLAYLTFRTLADWQGDPAELIAEPTALYKVLIDITVAHAGKGRDEGLQSVQSVHRGGEPLRRLLHKVASVISVLGREAVSFAELRNRLEEDDDTIKTWRSELGLRGIVDDATRESVLHELVVNFYFKGGNTSIGCEFLHKSFREYLFAEAIVAVLKDLSDGKSGPLQAPKVEYWQDFGDCTLQFKASRALSRLLAPQWLTQEVRTHLLWLLKGEIETEPERWEWICDLLLDVYIWWAEGVHLRPQPVRKRGTSDWNPAFVNGLLEYSLPFDPEASAAPIRSVALDAHLGDALMQITAAAHALRPTPVRVDPDRDGLVRPNYRRLNGGSRQFAPGGGGYFAVLCYRVNAAGWRPTGRFPVEAHLPAVELGKENCGRLVFAEANMINSSLKEVYLSHAYFYGANLERANLERANLEGANLEHANLEGANLKDANLKDANLEGANLKDANLEGANLEGANLEGANLKDAYLEGANLKDANLKGAYLKSAYLKSANLEGANLERANLERANLERANLKDANLKGADLKGANLEGARLEGANLESTNP